MTNILTIHFEDQGITQQQQQFCAARGSEKLDSNNPTTNVQGREKRRPSTLMLWEKNKSKIQGDWRIFKKVIKYSFWQPLTPIGF